jgi:hypothetical protein
MVSYDYGLLYDAVLADPQLLRQVVSSVLSAKQTKIFNFITATTASTGEVWTPWISVSDAVRGIYGKKCDVQARTKDLHSDLAEMSGQNMSHGIIVGEKISMAFEPFFLSWKPLNAAITSLYPRSFLRIISNLRCEKSVFESFVKKKAAMLHPLARASIGSVDSMPAAGIVSAVEKMHPFFCVEKARFKPNVVDRDILSRGVIGAEGGEAGIVPVDTLLNFAARQQPFKPVSKNRDEWKHEMPTIMDCDLVVHKAYSHLVEYLSREVRRRHSLKYDYEFFINVSLKDRVKELIRKIEKAKDGDTWNFCRWLASSVNHKEISESAEGRYDILAVCCEGADIYLKSPPNTFKASSLLEPKYPILNHMEERWNGEHPDLRFVYLSCLYGIPAVCAYVQWYRANKRDDRYTMDVGLGQIRALRQKRTTSSGLIEKVTGRYMIDHPLFLPYLEAANSIYDKAFQPLDRPDWPIGIYDYAVSVSSFKYALEGRQI